MQTALWPSFEGVLFDMDGLVIDSEQTYVRAWESAARAMGRPLPNGFAGRLFGLSKEAVLEHIRAIQGPAFEETAFFECAERGWFNQLEASGMPVMPGVEPLLDWLSTRGLGYVLATNSEALYAERCLSAAGLLERFPQRVSRDQVARGKPSPDLFLAAAGQLGLEPSQCLVLEDSPTGLAAARAAGAFPVLIQRDEALRDTLSDQAGAVFSDLSAFLTALSTPGPLKGTELS